MKLTTGLVAFLSLGCVSPMSLPQDVAATTERASATLGFIPSSTLSKRADVHEELQLQPWEPKVEFDKSDRSTKKFFRQFCPKGDESLLAKHWKEQAVQVLNKERCHLSKEGLNRIKVLRDPPPYRREYAEVSTKDRHQGSNKLRVEWTGDYQRIPPTLLDIPGQWGQLKWNHGKPGRIQPVQEQD